MELFLSKTASLANPAALWPNEAPFARSPRPLTRRLVLVVLALVSVGGCSASRSNPWTSTDLPRDRWDKDYSACRREADRDVGWRDDDAQSASPLRDYDRQQAKRRFDALVAECMTDRGYELAPKTRN